MCAWVAPATAVTGQVAEAADFNNHRDNLNETSAAKSTAAGDITYATGANALSRLAIGSSGQFLRVVSGIPGWSTFQVESGSTSGNPGYSTAVTFPNQFNAAPVVLANATTGAGAVYISISAISTASASFLINGGSSSDSKNFNWLAFSTA